MEIRRRDIMAASEHGSSEAVFTGNRSKNVEQGVVRAVVYTVLHERCTLTYTENGVALFFLKLANLVTARSVQKGNNIPWRLWFWHRYLRVTPFLRGAVIQLRSQQMIGSRQ